jgi:mevalonate pyrophosphate decarboxylase
VVELVKGMRKRGVPAYFSMQTGPTVYVNTLPEHLDTVEEELRRNNFITLRSGIGGGVELIA